MNVCNLACLIATGLFSSKVYLMVNYKKNVLLKQFDAILSKDQKERYQKIMKERLTIYIHGMIFGLLFLFALLMVYVLLFLLFLE